MMTRGEFLGIVVFMVLVWGGVSFIDKAKQYVIKNNIQGEFGIPGVIEFEHGRRN